MPCVSKAVFSRLALLFLCQLAIAGTQAGHLLVDSYGTLLLISPDGTQHPVAGGVNQAILSPDGSKLAFTTTSDPKVATSRQKLLIMSVEGGEPEQVTELPPDAHFGDIGWRPDGHVIAYEAIVQGKSDDLYIAPVPPTKDEPKSLGHWYQGFSFSPDGKQLVHAVNNHPAESGLEVVDIVDGKRRLLLKSATIVWDARYSPNGKYIAYIMTLRQPPPATDEEPDCTPPTLGLWLYSIGQKTSVQIVISAAPKDWEDVKNFAWSPDSQHIALTLATPDCDYPGGAAAVFLTDLSQTHQARISTGEMAFEPAFAPDGSAVAFIDLSSSQAKLMRYSVSSGRLDMIRQAPPESNYYSLRDWK